MGKAVLLLLAIGFPIALVLSWFYELTPEGIKRDEDVDHDHFSVIRSVFPGLYSSQSNKPFLGHVIEELQDQRRSSN